MALANVEINSKRNVLFDNSESVPNLKLVLDVVERKYCLSGYLRMVVNLKFENAGNKKVILHKYGTAIYEHFVSKNEKDLLEKKFESNAHYMVSFLGRELDKDLLPTQDPFVILEQGDIYNNGLTKVISVSVTDENGDCDGCLLQGKHILQVKVGTWPFKRKLGEQLRLRWQQYGYLWTNDLKSLPLEISVDSPQDVIFERCN
jgi:hypothetical protein